MKATVLPAVGIIVAGSLVGLVANAVRGRDSISLHRNYFKVAAAAVTQNMPAEAARESDGAESQATRQGAGASRNPFTPATIDDVVDWYQSDAYASGEIVFVDARADEAYDEGHIPGALHIDNYNVDRDFPGVQDDLEDARMVVVYCGGGDCSDSIYLATELEALGIERSKLRVFEGGITQWRDEELPVEEGPE